MPVRLTNAASASKSSDLTSAGSFASRSSLPVKDISPVRLMQIWGEIATLSDFADKATPYLQFTKPVQSYLAANGDWTNQSWMKAGK